MLAIKLQRIGRRHQPHYRVVVAERRSKLGAPPVEDLGSYNPMTKTFTIKTERAAHWLKIGAQPTVTVHNLFVKQGLTKEAKIPVKIKKPEPKAEAPAPGAAIETSASSEAPTEAPAAEEVSSST